MKALADLGIPQAVLPPQERPHLPSLKAFGFSGSPRDILQRAVREAPGLLASCSSASAMWTANAATVTPSCDTEDGRMHFTPANLFSKLHRSIEAAQTENLLKTIFSDRELFEVHPPLAGGLEMSDEGAANHTRLSPNDQSPGIHIFVYGRSSKETGSMFFPRQSYEASKAIARNHHLRPESCVFLKQSQQALDAGVFHNDVIAVGNGPVYLYHEEAYENMPTAIQTIGETYRSLHRTAPYLREVPSSEVPLEKAVSTYLFNSQIVETEKETVLIAPRECRESVSVSQYIEEMIDDSQCPINRVFYFDLRESMNNGGGPACLRLRVPMNAVEIEKTGGSVFLTDDLYAKLDNWIRSFYRETLKPRDLADPDLYDESCRALDELTQLMDLGSIYSFQREG